MSGYFEGWYYKQQIDGQTLALIPGRTAKDAFIQVITDRGSYHVPYSLGEYSRKGNQLNVGGNLFSPKGIQINIKTPAITLQGELRYQNLAPIRGDIMGPFRFFPMECRHGVVSMRHEVEGKIAFNGETRDYFGGVGYIESDCGHSFPSGYTWVQCNNWGDDCSIMASVARIPFAGLKFWGCIGVVWLNGREYRLATYKGVKILSCAEGKISLKQGKYRLDITIPNGGGHSLYAPRSGRMSRTIRENASCKAHFCFQEDNTVLFDRESNAASYEYAMDGPRQFANSRG